MNSQAALKLQGAARGHRSNRIKSHAGRVGIEVAGRLSVLRWEMDRETLEKQLDFAIKTAPKLTIQGGTTEVLRGIIARGLGLR